jgi:hypothetical protein
MAVRCLLPSEARLMLMVEAVTAQLPVGLQ